LSAVRTAWLVVLALLGASAVAGCTRVANTAKVDVVAGFYPLAFIAQRVGGDAVAVRDLTPPGVEPHEVELTVRQVVALHDSDLTVYLGGLAPAVDDAVHESRDRLDLAPVAHLESRAGVLDTHAWLDPERMRAMVRAVRDRLTTVDPGHAAGYRERAAALDGDLAGLDRDFRAGLRQCARTEVVTSHAAFGYLAQRYGLTQTGITGLVPDAEPAPGRLADVIRLAGAHHVTTIYFESVVSPKVAQTVATSVGARTAVLDPIETRPPSGDYLSGMRANLAALRAGLGCA
jgi:zinc transport system substrate-binding protein